MECRLLAHSTFDRCSIDRRIPADYSLLDPIATSAINQILALERGDLIKNHRRHGPLDFHDDRPKINGQRVIDQLKLPTAHADCAQPDGWDVALRTGLTAITIKGYSPRLDPWLAAAADDTVNELLILVNGHMRDFSGWGDHLRRLYITGDTMITDDLEGMLRRYPGIDIGFGCHQRYNLLAHGCYNDWETRCLGHRDHPTAIPIHYNDFLVFLSGSEEFKNATDVSSSHANFFYLAYRVAYTFEPSNERCSY